MSKFFLIIFLSGCIFICCTNKSNKKEYSITTYVTSMDNRDDFKGEKFKYSYEEFNIDSNLIYEELYLHFDNQEDKDLWGELATKSKAEYNGRKKEKTLTEHGIAYGKPVKTIYTYEYFNDNLVKVFSNGKISEEYKYNNTNQLLEKKNSDYNNSLLTKNFYNKSGLKVKSIYFIKDTLYGSDTFCYDNSQKLIEEIAFDSKGVRKNREKIIRDKKGLAIEKKWREPYNGWRMDSNGKIIEDEFYQSNKYFYDDKERLIKIEYYEIGDLKKVYNLVYD